MHTNSVIDYRSLMFWIAGVIFIVSASLYSITKRVSPEKRTRNYIEAGIFAFIFGVVFLAIILSSQEISGNDYRYVLYKILLFRKINLPHIPHGTEVLTTYYAIAASGLILLLIGVVRSITQAELPDTTEHSTTENMLKVPVVGKVSGNVDVREIFRNKDARLILAAFSIPMIVLLFGVYWYWYGSPFGYAALPGKSPPYTVGSKPMGIALDTSGNAWVASYGSNTVTALSPSGTVIGSYKVGKSPVGIAIDASGNVWVANYGSSTVTKLDPYGHTLGTFTSGSGPYGITIDAAGDVWVANLKDNSVTKLSSSGAVLGVYQVAVRKPFGLGGGINGIAVDASGNVWVTNDRDNTIIKLDPSGSIIGTYPAGAWPVGLAIDNSGNVWVATEKGVTKLGPDGTMIATFDTNKLVTGPESVAIDASGNVWVSITAGSDVMELAPDGTVLKTYSVGQAHEGIALDGAGNVWVANYGNNTVSKIIGATKGPQYFPYSGPKFPGGGNI